MTVRVATVQPPIAAGRVTDTDPGAVMEGALALLDAAGGQGAQAVCLPELVNAFGATPAEISAAAEPDAVGRFVDRVAELARRHRTWVICPVVETRPTGTFNAAKVIDADGEVVGCYDKTHLTGFEQRLGLTAGDSLPVFDADWGRFGIMTCYDGYFPEVARSLALDGADVIFYPAWQSGPSEIGWEIQMRARAFDQCVFLVRSSFGYAADQAWAPGMFFGRSCIIDRDGTIVADAGHHAGVAIATIDLAKPRLMIVDDDGTDAYDLRALMDADRRPDVYGRLVDPVRQETPAPHGAGV